jgi:eukaryotic-like serine/threonine-protein kinase
LAAHPHPNAAAICAGRRDIQISQAVHRYPNRLVHLGAGRRASTTIVIEGSFERDDHDARLKLTVIDPKKLREIGYVDVDGPTSDLAALQNQATTRLGRLINISPSGDQAHRKEEPAIRAAYEGYLAGLGYLQRADKIENLDLAIRAFQSTVETDPNFALGRARLAEAYAMKYRITRSKHWLEEAEAAADEARRLDPQAPATQVALGQISLLKGEKDVARGAFQEAMRLDPDNAEALTGIAHSYQNAGLNKEAEKAYLRAAALRPDYWNGYDEVGLFYENIARPHDAIAEYNRALALTPDNSWLYINLGIALMDLGDQAEAEKAFNRSNAIQRNFGAYANLAVLYGQQKRFRESAAASREALNLSEKNHEPWEVWDNLTKAYEWLGEERLADDARTHAIERLEEAVGTNKENAEARATLAALYAKNGLETKATDILKQLVASQPRNQDVLCQIAEAYEAMGERKNAVRYLQLAVNNGLGKSELNEDLELQGIISDANFRMPRNNWISHH